MKRRNFIKLGAAGLTGSTMGGLVLSRGGGIQARYSERSQQAGWPLKKGYMLGTFPSRDEYSIMQQFRMLREAGFDGAEPESGLDRSEVLEAKEATGLEIPSVVVSTHWSQPLSSPEESVRAAGLEGLRTALHDAREYGAHCVLLVPAVVNAEISYDEAWERSQQEIRKAIPLAEELGIVIAIENVWNHFLMSPLEAARYVDEFESPHIGWYFDTGNIINYGWPAQWIRILGERITMIHIKEFSREKRNDEGLYRGFQVNLTEGDNDWADIMQALGEIGYGGYGIAEPAYREEDVAVDTWLREYIGGRMDKIFAM